MVVLVVVVVCVVCWAGRRHPQEAANLLIPTTCRRCATVSPPSHSVGPCWVQPGGAPTITFIYR